MIHTSDWKMKTWGANANIVVRLLRVVPTNQNYRVFFDNYNTTLPLVVELSKHGIHSLGTVRRNRLQNCKLPDDKEMMKLPL